MNRKKEMHTFHLFLFLIRKLKKIVNNAQMSNGDNFDHSTRHQNFLN